MFKVHTGHRTSTRNYNVPLFEIYFSTRKIMFLSRIPFLTFRNG